MRNGQILLQLSGLHSLHQVVHLLLESRILAIQSWLVQPGTACWHALQSFGYGGPRSTTYIQYPLFPLYISIVLVLSFRFKSDRLQMTIFGGYIQHGRTSPNCYENVWLVTFKSLSNSRWYQDLILVCQSYHYVAERVLLIAWQSQNRLGYHWFSFRKRYTEEKSLHARSGRFSVTNL